MVKETAEAMGCFDRIDFLDDNVEIAISTCNDYTRYINAYTYAFAAFGNNALRKKWIHSLVDAGFTLPVLIHPTAYVSPSAVVREGAIVEVAAVINTNTVIDKGCIIGIGALIDHDCCIRECAHINAGVIVKAGCRVDGLRKVDAGIVYSDGF